MESPSLRVTEISSVNACDGVVPVLLRRIEVEAARGAVEWEAITASPHPPGRVMVCDPPAGAVGDPR